jgi:hypothetical protein
MTRDERTSRPEHQAPVEREILYAASPASDGG